ncbi:unnamed protein product [Allacma fusca]|uniref:Uncharacterized protein n=1 Tax=Allacma fusca TaxID=39272 RepID=A0A8J2PDA7_9HEXA|nr:unnamed protein product [Allacma fusca]
MEKELLFPRMLFPTEPPPPYNFEEENFYDSPSALPGPCLNRFAAWDSAPSPLELLIGSCEELSFLAVRKSGFVSSGTIKVHVYDGNDDLILTTVLDKKASMSSRTGSVVSFVDNGGNALLNCKETGNTIVVTGDRHFGSIEKAGTNILTFPSKFEALSELGEEIFVAKREVGTFKFISKGSVIAAARHRKTNRGKVCTLKFLHSLDLTTKVLLVVTATLVDILFFPVNEY